MRLAIRRRLAITLVGLTALAVSLLMGWFPQKPLRAPAERLAGEWLGARVSIGELTLTPGLLRLRADRVRVEALGWTLEARSIETAAPTVRRWRRQGLPRAEMTPRGRRVRPEARVER